MPQGRGSTLRTHADAKRAAKMKAEGMTTRQIAAALGCKPEQVKSRVALGERLNNCPLVPRALGAAIT